MTMTTICNIDASLIFTGDKATMPDDRQPIPRGWVATEPPKGEGIWQWQSVKWGKLDKYPEVSTPAAKTDKTKEEYIIELEAKQEKEALIALIDERIALAADPKEPIKP